MVIDRDSTQNSKQDSTQDSRKRNIVALLLIFASLFLFVLIYSLLASLGFSLQPQPALKIHPPDRPQHKIPNRAVVVDSARVFAPQLL